MSVASLYEPLVLPDDEHNRVLVRHVRPPDWIYPRPASRYNLVVLGAGTAGLVSAVGAASLGAKVAIVERHLMGGACLNFGCVPSKALLSAAVRVSGRRFMARPFYYAILMNVLPALYRVGVPAARLARAYGDVR